MAKVPKHRRIKRATVLIKRTRCIKNTKSKSYPPLYQKLKVNNHSLARALSQEKQESQLLFSRNVELLSEVQDLVHACNNRDLVISKILKNAKDMMQVLVTMSGFLTNIISSCQEFVSNQVNTQRTSTNSTGRRESTRRMSTKSPARGVVKPMVSGHTITKPTINLSRVNMQRLQNVNLSIIEEGPSTPERNLERSVERRRSRILPERLPVPALRTEDDEERVIVNRRTSRYSGGRLSLGRYSKRNSGRLSGGLSSRLSLRGSEYSELLKSPRVALQDVSRFLTNNQTVNIRSLSDTTSGNQTNNSTAIEDTQMSDQFSPENSHVTIIPETQAESCDTSNSEQDPREEEEEEEEDNDGTVVARQSALNSVTVMTSTTATKNDKSSSSKRSTLNQPASLSSIDDPLEGPSWLQTSREMESPPGWLPSSAEEEEDPSMPIICKRRRNVVFGRVSRLPSWTSRQNADDDSGTPRATGNASTNIGLDASSSSLPQNADDSEDDRHGDLSFVTQRRGPFVSVRNSNLNGETNDVEDDDDDETIMMNIRRQLRQQPTQPVEQPERLQFDINELLQMTPLKPLLSINGRTNNGPAQVEVQPEATATVQIPQKSPERTETVTFGRMSTMKVHQPDLPALITVRSQEAGNDITQERRLTELTTVRLSTRIELPRLTNVLNTSDDNHQQSQMILTPEHSRQQEVPKRKRVVMKPLESAHLTCENEEEAHQQRKKKPEEEDKDPSTAKVVLQKLKGANRVRSQNESVRSERKNSDESISSTRSSLLSRVDQSSNSENSTASYNSRPMRPKREKAPKNLQEPNLNKKLRR